MNRTTRRQEQRERTRKRKKTTKLFEWNPYFTTHCLYWSVFNAWLSTEASREDSLRYTRYIFAGIIPEGWKESVDGLPLLGRYFLATGRYINPVWRNPHDHRTPQERLVDYATMLKKSQE